MSDSKSQHILHVIATLNRGGTEVACLGLVRGLHQLGFKNTVVAMQAGALEIVPAFEGLTSDSVILPPTRRARLKAFDDILKRERPDAVIFHFFTIDHVLLAAVAKRAGVGRITVKQGNPVGTGFGLRQKLKLILMVTRWLGVGLVSASHWIERSMAGLGKLPKNATVVHNGCDTAAIAASATEAQAAKDPQECSILMIARLDPIKDHKTLIHAVAKMPEQIGGRRVMLTLAGDGVLRKQLEDEARQAGVAERLQFLGARSDIPELLGRADVFCLSTTRDEGFGVVLIEALAAGTPVVATRVPACEEVLENGALGVLVPARSPALLAAALQAALTHESKVPSLEEVAGRYDNIIMAQRDLQALGLSGDGPEPMNTVDASTI